MKPNISSDWLTQLRQRLKSNSTEANSSGERTDKSPGAAATADNQTSGKDQPKTKPSNSGVGAFTSTQQRRGKHGNTGRS